MTDKKLEDLIKKNIHGNYSLDAEKIVSEIRQAVIDELTDKVISYIRSGEVAGSFSEGCDCEKCNQYEKKVRAAIKKLRDTNHIQED